MAKRYTRKQVGSLQDLDREQQRVKRMAGKMEEEWLDKLLNPQQIAMSLVTSFLSRRKNSGGGSAINLFSGAKGKSKPYTAKAGEGKLKQVGAAVMAYAKQPAVKGVVKRVGISFLRWQAFNLAWFLGKKAYKAIQKKQAERKLLQQAEKLVRQRK